MILTVALSAVPTQIRVRQHTTSLWNMPTHNDIPAWWNCYLTSEVSVKYFRFYGSSIRRKLKNFDTKLKEFSQRSRASRSLPSMDECGYRTRWLQGNTNQYALEIGKCKPVADISYKTKWKLDRNIANNACDSDMSFQKWDTNNFISYHLNFKGTNAQLHINTQIHALEFVWANSILLYSIRRHLFCILHKHQQSLRLRWKKRKGKKKFRNAVFMKAVVELWVEMKADCVIWKCIRYWSWQRLHKIHPELST